MALPVVSFLPDFIFDLVTPEPTSPWPEAPGAGWVCAAAMMVEPAREAATRAVSMMFDRIGNFSLKVMPESQTAGLDFGSSHYPRPAVYIMPPSAPPDAAGARCAMRRLTRPAFQRKRSRCRNGRLRLMRNGVGLGVVRVRVRALPGRLVSRNSRE